MNAFIITAKSESGDFYGPWGFIRKPTDQQLERFLREVASDEFPEANDGPGDFGSYLYLYQKNITLEDPNDWTVSFKT